MKEKRGGAKGGPSLSPCKGSRQPSNRTINQEGPRTDREPVYVTRKPSPYGFRRANTLVARKLGRKREPPFSSSSSSSRSFVQLGIKRRFDRLRFRTIKQGATDSYCPRDNGICVVIDDRRNLFTVMHFIFHPLCRRDRIVPRAIQPSRFIQLRIYIRITSVNNGIPLMSKEFGRRDSTDD